MQKSTHTQSDTWPSIYDTTLILCLTKFKFLLNFLLGIPYFVIVEGIYQLGTSCSQLAWEHHSHCPNSTFYMNMIQIQLDLSIEGYLLNTTRMFLTDSIQKSACLLSISDRKQEVSKFWTQIKVMAVKESHQMNFLRRSNQNFKDFDTLEVSNVSVWKHLTSLDYYR